MNTIITVNVIIVMVGTYYCVKVIINSIFIKICDRHGKT